MKATLSEGVLNVVLDSPKTHNAFDHAQSKILLKSLKSKNIKLIVISAVGRVFCSGGQLRDYAALKTKAQGVKVNREIRLALEALAKYPAPKIAAVTGDCFGGGIELISCCDWIISEPHVFFGLWQRKMELSFGWGGYKRLKSRMSETQIKNWLLTANVKTASEAMRLGLIDQISLDIKNDLKLLVEKTQAFSNASYHPIKQGLDKNESQVFEQLWFTPAHRHALKKYTTP